jgi:hypothetical protein
MHPETSPLWILVVRILTVSSTFNNPWLQVYLLDSLPSPYLDIAAFEAL